MVRREGVSSAPAEAGAAPRDLGDADDRALIDAFRAEAPADKQALIKQEYELKILIIAHYGENVYNEMIMERIRLKKEREKKATPGTTTTKLRRAR